MPQYPSVFRALYARASEAPQAIALSAMGHSALSYGELASQLDTLAHDIQLAGHQQGQAIATLTPNGPDAAVAILGSMLVGPCAPLSSTLSAAETLDLVERMNVDVIVTAVGWTSPALEAVRAAGISVVEMQNADENRVRGSRPSMPDADAVALLLSTSGTTARAKIVPLTHANLHTSAANISSWLGLDAADRCLNVLPLFHVHGLVSNVLATLITGGEVVCAPGFEAGTFFETLWRSQATWFSAVPTIHQAIVERARRVPGDAAGVQQSPLRFIRSASAPLPEAVAGQLESLFGVPLIEVYGMTEAAGQITSSPMSPGARRSGTVGGAAGPDVAVVDALGHDVPRGTTGEIVVRGGNVIQAYADSADNLDGFFGDWLRTGDLGVLHGDGFLSVTGRLKDAINRGGETINPQEIDAALLRHPSVGAAVTFAVPDRRLGEQVAAAVVLHGDVEPDALRRFVAETLSMAKVPRRIVVLDALPMGKTGKVKRNGMAELLGLCDLDDGAPADDVGHGNSRTQQRLTAFWCEVLNVSHVRPNDRFLDLGGDSLSALRLLSIVNDTFGVRVPLLDFFDCPTLVEQAALVDAALGAAATATPPQSAIHTEPAAAHERVERTLRRHRCEQPDRTAIEAKDAKWSYEQLDSMVDALASAFVRRGMVADTLVGVAIPQSAWLVAAVLALHRIGAGYVHLDASLPTARRTFIIDDAQLRFIICHRGLAVVDGVEQSAELIDIASLHVDDGMGAVATALTTDPVRAAARAAYVIYTSGSTGTPKGVVVAQSALSAFVQAAARRFAIAADDRVLQFHSPSFDASVEEIFVTLAVGATLVIRDEHTLGSTRWFLDDVSAKGVTVLNLPTSLWHTLVRDLGSGRAMLPATVRSVIFGGEAASATLVSAWTRAVGTRARLFNAYGPTETTVDAVVHELTGLSFPDDAPVPIGRPLDGVHVFVLDADDRPLGPGDVGELHIGGPTLATGYLRRPALTSERFVTLPSVSPQRLYRTGDRVSITADGLLVYHGRRDDQVKVRGHRVELSEVEALLGAIDGIAAAVVLAHRRADTMTLIAHVVPDDPSWGPNDVLNAARPCLPEYFVPSSVVIHRTLPRTTGDKVDRGALRATPDVADVIAPSPYQLAVWLDHQMNPDDASSNLVLSWKLTGPLDVDAMDRALTAVITRHDALRSRIEVRGGSPSLVIEDPRPCRFDVTELRDPSHTDADAHARMIVAASASAPFDLAHDLPWRAIRVRLDDRSSYLVMVLHHSVADGMSLTVIQRDLAQAYAAIVQGAPEASRPLPLGYREALRAIERRAGSQRHADDLRWWVQQLTDAPSRSTFVSANPSTRADERNELIIAHEGTAADAWSTLARALNTTPFVIGLSLVIATLRQLGGDDELTLSTPVSDREMPGSEHLVGMFVNLTVLRARAVRGQTFRELIADMRRRVADAMDRRGVAFPDLVRQLRPARSARRNPLADVSFQMMLPSRPPLALPGLTTVPMHTDYKPSREGLEVQASLEGGVLTIACRRNPEVLDYGAMEQFARAMWANALLLLNAPDAQLPTPTAAARSARARGRATPVAAPRIESGRSESASALVDTIAAILRDALDLDHVGPDDDFFELGGHSLLAIRLLSELETLSGVPLPPATLLEHRTARALASLLAAPKRSEPSRILIPLGSSDSSLPALYCLHPAGGGVYMYEQLQRRFARHTRVVGIVERGFDGMERTSSDCATMARDYLAEIAASGAPSPEFLAGYSTGGFLAYEMACQLADAGAPPKLVVLFDTQFGDPAPRSPVRKFLDEVSAIRHDGLGNTVTRYRKHQRWAADQRRNERLWNTAVRTGIPADPIVAETMSFRRNIAMIDTFPARLFAGHVLFVRSNGEGMKDPVLHAQSPEHWSCLCTGAFDLLDVTGVHNSGPHSMFVEPYVDELVAAIEPLLLQYQQCAVRANAPPHAEAPVAVAKGRVSLQAAATT